MSKTYIVRLSQDDVTCNPRDDYDSIGMLYTWHPRYPLGGRDDYNHQEHIHDIRTWALDHFSPFETADFDDFSVSYGSLLFQEREALPHEQKLFETLIDRWMEENLVIVPVYLYDHSGITISTRPFSCPWDSGQVGIIYTTKTDCKRANESFEREYIKGILRGEIEMLDQYLAGDVWQYSISEFTGNEKELEELLDSLSEVDTLHEDEKMVIYTTSSYYDNDSILIYKNSCGGYYGFKDVKDTIISDCTSFCEDTIYKTFLFGGSTLTTIPIDLFRYKIPDS